MGEENKNYFLKRFLQTQLPLVASLLFFIAGLTFFTLSKMEPGQINLSLLQDKIIRKASFDNTPKAIPAEIKKPAVPEPSTTKPKQKEISETSSLTPITPEPQLKREESDTAQPVLESPTPKAQEPANNPAVKQGGNYRIQVYSLKTQAEADEHVGKLTTAGFDTFWKKAVSAGQDWYIVYVGPFKDLNSAKVNLKALKFSGRKPILFSVSTTG